MSDTELSTASAISSIADADLLPTRKAGVAGWLKVTYLQIAEYVEAALGIPETFFTVAGTATDGFVPKLVSGTPTWSAESGGGGASTLAGLTDVDTTGATDGQVLTWDNTEGKWEPVTPSGGGGGATPPALRGTPTIQYSSSLASFDMALPVGAAVGDTGVIFMANGYAPNLPSGWTSEDTAGSTMNGMIIYKVLDSGDISAGHITVTTAAAYSFVAAIAVFVGTFTVRATRAAFQQNISVSKADAQVGDYALYATFSRDFGTPPYNGNGVTLASSRGAPDARANGYLSGEALTKDGGVTHATEAGGYWWSGLLILAHA